MRPNTDNSKSARGSQRPKDAKLVERREDEILNAAASVFAQYGYREADVEVIADAIGVGKGTVYRYFPTKQTLFFASVDRVMQNLEKRLRERAYPVEDPVRRMEATIREYLAFFDENPEFIELLMLERAEFKGREKPTYFRYQEENLPYWENTIKELMAAGRIREMPVWRILDVVSDLLYGVIFTDLFSGREKSFEEQAQDIVDVVFHGILSESEVRKK